MSDDDGKLHGLLAELPTPGALLRAAEAVRKAGYTKWDCYSPFPVHGIDQAMGVKRTILPWVVFGGGMVGGCLAMFLEWWANAYDWPWLVSGKPFFSIPAAIPIAYEGTVLFSALTAFLTLWAFNKLPKLWNPWARNDRFLKATDDGFFIGIEAEDDKFDPEATAALLRDAGAVAVERCHLDADPALNRLPRPILSFIVVTTLLAVIPVGLVASARSSTTTLPRLHVITDMDFQFKQKSDTETDQFDDHRVMRLPVEGTVAVGELHTDDHFYRGIVRTAAEPSLEPAPEGAGAPAPTEGYSWAQTFPTADPARGVPGITLDDRTMARGRERFGIYCAPCHGLSGHGDGMVHQRATKVANQWTPPVDLSAERVVRMPHGQLFFTIGNGVRNMPGYATQLTPQDRWAIVLYVRALERSQRATVEDVPAAERATIRPGQGAP